MNKIVLESFLDGKIKVYQYEKGYKSGVDAPLLVSFIKDLREDSKVLELGSGVGVASLCLASRLIGIEIVALEKNEDYFSLAKKNAEINKDLPSKVIPILGNVLDDNKNFNNRFDIVFSNPPYYKSNKKNPSFKDIANIETDAGLQDFISCAFKALKNQGYLYIILRSERLKELLDVLPQKHWGDINIYPIFSFVGKKAKRFVIRARKLAANVSHLHYGIVLHNEDKSYSKEAISILKYGKSFEDK